MTAYSTENIAALIGSRICHDLISPIGAVNNGLELLTLSGERHSPEMSLVADSAANANARISLFRLAFGIASTDQVTRREDLCRIWSNATQDRGLTLEWQGPDCLERPLAQSLTLALLCLEKALPRGGTLTARETDGNWVISGTGSHLKVEEAMWDALMGHHPEADMPPSHVQFLLLPQNLANMNRQCQVHRTHDTITLSF